MHISHSLRTILASLGFIALTLLPAAPARAQQIDAVDDTYTVARGATLNVPAPGVLDNDCCPKRDPLSAQLVSPPSAGTLTLAADGGFTYVHDGSAGSSDSFTYEAVDGNSTSNVATVTLTLFDASIPEAADDNYQVEVGTTLVVNPPGLLLNDTDLEGDPLTVATVNGAAANVGATIPLAFGSLTVAADGSFTYAHNGTIPGDPDVFTYQATDGGSTSGTASVSLSAVDPTTSNPVELTVLFPVIEEVRRSTWLSDLTNEELEIAAPGNQFAWVTGAGMPPQTSLLTLRLNDGNALDKAIALFDDCQRQALLAQARPADYMLEITIHANNVSQADVERILLGVDGGVVKCTLKKPVVVQ